MVKIVTDSLSDISQTEAKELGITVVPLNIHFGDTVYKDNIDLSPDEFYQKLTAGEVYPTTSAPAPGLFVELYKKLSKESDDGILAVMASNKISAVHESALQAKSMVPECNVEVINTWQLCGGLALLVRMANDAAKSGAKLNEIAELVKKYAPKAQNRMILDTLEYLKRGGRIGKAQALLGSILKIHPVIKLTEGEVHPAGKARNRAQAIEFITTFVKSIPKLRGLCVEHAAVPEEMESLIDKLSEYYPKEKIVRERIGPTIGAHVGPHSLAVHIVEG
jgi:DegV family protein with EDD domain